VDTPARGPAGLPSVAGKSSAAGYPAGQSEGTSVSETHSRGTVGGQVDVAPAAMGAAGLLLVSAAHFLHPVRKAALVSTPGTLSAPSQKGSFTFYPWNTPCTQSGRLRVNNPPPRVEQLLHVNFASSTRASLSCGSSSVHSCVSHVTIVVCNFY